MLKGPLTNTKVAIMFAVITIVGTVVIVAPQGGGGVLEQTVDRLGQQGEVGAEKAPRRVKKAREEAEPLDPADGWGGTADPAFGEFNNEPNQDSREEQRVEPASASGESEPRDYEQTGPVGGAVVPDAPGIVPPRG